MSDKQKGKKVGNIKPSDRVYYKTQFTVTERNKQKNLGRHLRHHPGDVQSRAFATKVHGEKWVSGTLANATMGGIRRMERNLNPEV